MLCVCENDFRVVDSIVAYHSRFCSRLYQTKECPPEVHQVRQLVGSTIERG